MNHKNKFFIIGLILLVIISVSVVSANENETVLDESSDDIQTSENQHYNAYIFADDVNVEYSQYNKFNALYVDDDGDHIYGGNLKIEWNDGLIEDLYEWDDYDGYNTYIDREVGSYTIKVYSEDYYYNAYPVTLSVNISKATPKLTAKEWYSTTDQYSTLKVIVKDKHGDNVDEGTVKFTIDGKSYNVDVKEGVAIKKIKLSKAKTYLYSATFSGKNYYNKTVSSKVHVLSTSKSARTFYLKGYKITLSLYQFKKLLDAKNNNKRVYFEVNTGKYIKQTYKTVKETYKWVLHKKNTYPYGYYYDRDDYKVKNLRKIWLSDGEYDLVADIYKKVYSTKIITKTVKARVSIIISYGGKTGGQFAFPNKYCLYLNTPYQNPGYEDCKPWIYGAKTSSSIKNLNSAPLTKY